MKTNKWMWIVILLLLIALINKSPSMGTEGNGNATSSSSSSSGGGGGGGGGGSVTPINGQDSCQLTASANGYSYYKSPLSQLSCFTYAFGNCQSKGMVTNGVAYSDALDCCVWNCKTQTDGGDGTEPPCTDSDSGIEPFIFGTVSVPRLAVMYPDACTNEAFNRYLHEWYCENGIAKMTTIDCWGSYGAICGNGRCQQMPCEQISNPNSQADCDRGHPCTNTGEETYCKFVAGVASPNRCVCTIEPSSVNSCERACWFAGGSEGYCYTGPIIKNPCGTAEHLSSGDSYCPIGQSIRTCCCR